MLKREGDWYIAHCPPLDITTQGRTQAEARRNLIEASELFLISCLERRSLDQALRELGFTHVQKLIARRPDNAFPMVIPVPLGFQKSLSCHA
jgi:predicted RNase H-like HicB family nuclease